MNREGLVARLAAGGRSLASLFEGVTGEQARWRPDIEPGHWSVVEVAGHLLEEERLDFRPRIDLVLNHPGREWPAIDPVGWVAEHHYAAWDLADTVAAWREERRASVRWLQTLDSVDWGVSYEHPALGSLQAGDLLAAWVAHDALHMRQLAKLHFLWGRNLAGDFSPAYAGDW